jgi:hypothetical protein
VAPQPTPVPDEWIGLCPRYRDDARALEKAKHPKGSWLNAGFAVECCLKAAIMKKDRLNRWPDPDAAPDLWTHDLRGLTAGATLILEAKLTPGSIQFLVEFLHYRVDQVSIRCPLCCNAKYILVASFLGLRGFLLSSFCHGSIFSLFCPRTALSLRLPDPAWLHHH